CRRQFSRYTCPRCNLAYCSIPCFRSEGHAQCSESFYRTQLESDINTTPSKSIEERKQMMDLLKRFEEDNLDDPFENIDDDDDNEGEVLEKRLAGLDLDDASYDQLWATLTPAERSRFLNAVRDPSSELAQELLASPSIMEDVRTPWWEVSDAPAPLSSHISAANSNVPKTKGDKPDIMVIPSSLNSFQPLPSFPLAYNLVAIFLAYAYITRHFAYSPLSHPSFSSPADARDTIRKLVPFLPDKRSKTILETLDAAVTDVWSRFEPGTVTPALFTLLLQDVATLLHPRRVIPIDRSSSSPESALEASLHINAILALSDLHQLFLSQGDPSVTARASGERSPNSTVAKLMFYEAQVNRLSVDFMYGLSDEVEARALREGSDSPAVVG
ncbi:hypothetical protein OF83DRAFT_1061091, partial [Amylostereum chailletii]